MVDPQSHMANWIDRHSIIKMVKLSKLPTPKRYRMWVIQAKSILKLSEKTKRPTPYRIFQELYLLFIVTLVHFLYHTWKSIFNEGKWCGILSMPFSRRAF